MPTVSPFTRTTHYIVGRSLMLHLCLCASLSQESSLTAINEYSGVFAVTAVITLLEVSV